MINIPQIPAELLIHSVAYFEYDPGERYGESWKDPVILERVRVEPLQKVIRGGNGDQVTSVATLFVDTVNSLPQPLPDFTLKSKILFNGREMYIAAPEPLYALDPAIPHHWEILLE